MKNKIFTIALTLMGYSFLFAQQWTGANNTTSDISRTGKVSIGTASVADNLNVDGSIGIGHSSIKFYDKNNLMFPNNYMLGVSLQGYNDPTGYFWAQTLSIGGSYNNEAFILVGDKIGMGTNELYCSDCTDYRLFVKDGIRTEKIKVDIAANNGWADYVFEPDYNLMSLAEVEQFIKQNGHLPEVPTTEQAIANGIELKEMNILLLKKVEELTLYSIQQQKELEELKAQMSNLLKEQK